MAAKPSPTVTQLARYRRIMSGRPHPLQSVDAVAVITPCQRHEVICDEGQTADCWYYVIIGAVLCSVVRVDGRRQVVDLLLPGDFFGFTTGDEHVSTIEAAAAGTVVAVYPRRRIEMEADADPRLSRDIRKIAFDAFSRLQGQLQILGRITVQEKVGSFILAMGERLIDSPDDSVALPFSRYDIADYLAVSVETVSRSLTDLKRRGLIKFTGTRVVRIVNRNALDGGERHKHQPLPPATPGLVPRAA
jgi:CRP/FNR family nitrogen fixation transcriptional regulator